MSSISKFGTRQEGSSSVDLTAYARRTDVNALLQTDEQLTTKVDEIEEKVDTVRKMDGPIGPVGPRGAGWWNTFVDPSADTPDRSQDYMLNATDGVIYKAYGKPLKWHKFGSIKGPQGSRGEVGPKGKDGPQGPRGPVWHSGDKTPGRAFGTSNDYYINTSTFDVFKKYELIGWVKFGNLRGLKGSTGERGPVGLQGPLSVSVRRWMYRGILDILKTMKYYALTTPDTHFSNVEYTPQKTVTGNYATESYTTNPYPTIQKSVLGAKFYVYSAYKFDALDGSDNLIVFLEAGVDKYGISRRLITGGSLDGEVHLFNTLGQRGTGHYRNFTKDEGSVFIDVEVTITSSGITINTTLDFNKQIVVLLHSGDPVQETNTTVKAGAYASGDLTQQYFFAISKTPLNELDKDELKSFFVTNRI